MKAGDLFAVPMGAAGFVTAHALLHVDDPRTKKHLPRGSRLYEHGSLLLDVYGPATPEPDAAAAEVMIRGIWTDDVLLDGADAWRRIGRRPVVPQQVEFPEYVFNHSGVATFERGEIRVEVRRLSSALDRIVSRQPYVSMHRLWRIATNLVGRGDLLGEEAILHHLEGTDLRHTPHRAEVYDVLNIDPARTYWDWALDKGVVPGRFWR